HQELADKQKPPIHQDGRLLLNFCGDFISARFLTAHRPRSLFAIKAPYVSIAGCQTPSRKSFPMSDEIVTGVGGAVQSKFCSFWLSGPRRPETIPRAPVKSLSGPADMSLFLTSLKADTSNHEGPTRRAASFAVQSRRLEAKVK